MGRRYPPPAACFWASSGQRTPLYHFLMGPQKPHCTSVSYPSVSLLLSSKSLQIRLLALQTEYLHCFQVWSLFAPIKDPLQAASLVKKAVWYILVYFMPCAKIDSFTCIYACSSVCVFNSKLQLPTSLIYSSHIHVGECRRTSMWVFVCVFTSVT